MSVEVAQQFLFLGVDAQHGPALRACFKSRYDSFCESLCHEIDHGDVTNSFAIFGDSFVIF